VVFLALGMAPFKAVVYATLVGIGFGIIEIVLTHRRQPAAILRAIWDVIFGALSTGIRSVLPVTSVCAAAGIIVSTITKTGLGQVISDILVKGAQAISTNPTA
ncbi:C4-dicarboxylate ABC transporter permease, partial [Burkholderia multivorans]